MQNDLQERQASPPINGIDGQSSGPYNMDIIVEPPAESLPGAVLYPSLVVRIRRQQDTDDTTSFNELWASVFLTGENEAEVLAPPRTDLLAGMMVNSVRQVFGDEGETGYVTFPGLTIRQTGSYRIRICLIRMGTSQTTFDASSEGGVNVQMVHSQVIRVHSAAHPTEPCESSPPDVHLPANR